jgi:hypothetical protein
VIFISNIHGCTIKEFSFFSIKASAAGFQNTEAGPSAKDTPASPIDAFALPTPISRKFAAVDPYLYIFCAKIIFNETIKAIKWSFFI